MHRLLATVLLLLSVASSVQAQTLTIAPPSQEDKLAKLARQIEPDLVGRAERLPQYVDFFQSKLGNDNRLFAFNVQATAIDSGKVRLRGYVEFSQTREGLVGFLSVLGFDVLDDQLETLPDQRLGKKVFGFVKTSHALSYSQAAEPRSVVTDCLLGERLYLLREEGDHLLVHSGEGYLGYVAASDVHRVDASAFAHYPTNSSVRIIADHSLNTGLVIPTGARLKLLSGKDKVMMCALPSGETVEIPQEVCILTTVPKAEIEQIVASGKRLLDTPYLWGGKTSDGIDCSGLMQMAFATVGGQLPRDSNQQFLLGELTATRWHRSGLRRGDTLYFLGSYGRIRHTALYLGEDRYLQAEMPTVDIRSFNPKHEDYDEDRAASFAFGKRLWQ